MNRLIKWHMIGVLAAVVLATSWLSGRAEALSGSQFQPGRIIDDQVFYDGDAMSVAQIQSFLASKVPACDTNGNQPYYGTYKGVTYNGNVLRKNLDPASQPPFTCVRDYSENTSTKDNNYGRAGYSVPGGISAAQIIANEAIAYNINPKVLLVLIQKESSLLTDDWPWAWQYRSATGYGCPDTAACSSTYYGFYNQVHNAARQFRLYANNPLAYNYVIGANNIKYHPDPSSCGTQRVTIVNSATAGLYNYTPYVPNQAALNNLYGLGDGCSAYGNRNFWRLFNDWFGPTLVPTYDTTISSVSVNADLSNMVAGSTATITYRLTNTGTATWTKGGNNPVKLGTFNPTDRQSPFCTTGWMGCNRAALLEEDSVAPGEIGTFQVTIKAPRQPGEYREFYRPLAEGLAWFPTFNNNMYIRVVPAVYSYKVAGQATYTDNTKTTSLNPALLSPGQRGWMLVRLLNTGNVTWYRDGTNPIKLGTDGARDRSSRLCTTGWAGCNRPARLAEASVAPGATGTFEWPIAAQASSGEWREYFTPVAEGITWMNTGLNFLVRVNGVYSWQVVGQYAATNSSKTTGVDLANLTPGQKVWVGILAKNTGTATWYRDGLYPIKMGTSHPVDRASPFCDSSWLGCNRPAKLAQASVAPGEVADFGFWYVAPSTRTVYREYYNLVAEGLTWLNNPGVNHYSVVR